MLNDDNWTIWASTTREQLEYEDFWHYVDPEDENPKVRLEVDFGAAPADIYRARYKIEFEI